MYPGPYPYWPFIILTTGSHSHHNHQSLLGTGWYCPGVINDSWWLTLQFRTSTPSTPSTPWELSNFPLSALDLSYHGLVCHSPRLLPQLGLGQRGFGFTMKRINGWMNHGKKERTTFITSSTINHHPSPIFPTSLFFPSFAFHRLPSPPHSDPSHPSDVSIAVPIIAVPIIAFSYSSSLSLGLSLSLSLSLNAWCLT